MKQKTNLTDTLEAIESETEGDSISFHDLVTALNRRGFGALLIGPALITILPTGAIPGVPALCAVFIILVAAQVVLGRKHPWLPKKLKDMSFNRDKYLKGIQKAKPYTKRIDGFFHPRLRFLTHEASERVISLLCVFLSVAIIVLGFIPFAAMLPASAILLFGLGLSVHDGLLTAFGFALMGATFAAIPFLF